MISKYPWNDWLNRKNMTIVQGRDYTVTPMSMVANIRKTAAKYKVRVGVFVEEKVIYMHVKKRPKKLVIPAVVKHTGYPWPNWFKKSRFTLVRGKHFKSQIHGMVAQIRTAAKKHLPKNATVSIEVVEDTIVVTVVK